MALIIPNKFATRTGSIQLAELDDNFQLLADEFDRYDVAIGISGTSITAKGNLKLTGTLNVPGSSTLGTLNVTGNATAPTPAAATNNTQLATTAFVKTVIASSVSSAIPTGVITMWYGSIATIPTGWYLCDGNNGTPDLRSRFVVGAGSTYAVGNTGGTADAIVPSHTHTASSSTSTSISDPGHRHWISSMATDDRNITGTGGNGQEYGIVSDAGSYSPDDPNKSTGRYTLGATTGISASSSTTTTVNSTGVSATNANLPPYYALAYIMKA